MISQTLLGSLPSHSQEEPLSIADYGPQSKIYIYMNLENRFSDDAYGQQ